MLVVACDPGASGGFALFRDKKLQSVLKSDIFPRDFAHAVSFYACEEPVICIIEDVHGVEGQNAKNSFTFGYHFGRSHLMLEMISGEYVRKVNPAVWMKYLSVPKGLPTTERKNLILDKMVEEHPHFGSKRLHLWNSDAVGIGTYFINNLF